MDRSYRQVAGDTIPCDSARENELRDIARSFKADGATVLTPDVAVAAGIGGVGKSELATEFAYRYGCYFTGGVFWLNFEDPADINQQVGGCSVIANLESEAAFRELPRELQVDAVTDLWRRSAIPRLLIFDNCEDANLLSKWRPVSGNCRVLATSRIDTWPRRAAVNRVPIDTLPRERSIELLAGYRDDLNADDPTLGDIADLLGDLPLALHLAGSYLEAYEEVTPSAYLERIQDPGLLQDASLSAEHKGGTLTDRDKGVAATLKSSLDRLDRKVPVDVAAIRHLVLAAALAPGEPIPVLLMTPACAALDSKLAEHEIRDGLNRLRRVGLVTGDQPGHVTIHRLVGHFARDLIEGADAAAEVMGRVLFEQTSEINGSGRASGMLPLQIHLLHLANQLRMGDVAVAGYLDNQLGDHLVMVGDLAAALQSYKAGLEIRKRLAEADPSNAGWQRDVWASMWRLRDFEESGITWRDIARKMEEMDCNGTLLPTDREFLERARAEATKE